MTTSWFGFVAWMFGAAVVSWLVAGGLVALGLHYSLGTLVGVAVFLIVCVAPFWSRA